MYKKIILVLFFLFLITIIYLPSLRVNFLLIDDGQIVLISRQIASFFLHLDLLSISKIIFEPQEGRVRPAYWLIQSFISAAALYKPFLIHFYRVLILVLSSVLIFKINIRLKINAFWSCLSAFFFILNFQNIENYYRLGPTEVFLGLFYLLLILKLLINKKKILDYLWIFFILLFGAFTKETFFLITLPFLAAGLLIKDKKFCYTGLVGLSLGVVVLLIKHSYGGNLGYSQNYEFSLPIMYVNLKSYLLQINYSQFPVFIFSVFAFIYYIFTKFRKGFKQKLENKDIYLFVFIANFMIQIVSLSPWKFVLSRYLILVNISLVFVYAILIDFVWKNIETLLLKKTDLGSLGLKNIKYLLPLIFVSVFVVRNVFPLANFQLWEQSDSNLTQSILKSLSTNIPKDTTVFVNYKKGDDNIEIYLETGWHLEEFFSRPDIRFEYLDNDSLCTRMDRFIFDRKSSRFLDRDVLIKNKLQIVDFGESVYSPINYGIVRNSFISGVKYPEWHQDYVFDWTIFKQIKNTCIKI